MQRLVATIKKDLLILLRDKGGLAVMFLMPIALIIIMSLIQDGPFRDFQELKIPLLIVNNDKGSLGQIIEDSLKTSKVFVIKDSQVSTDEAKKIVAEGKYLIGIVIPANASAALNKKVKRYVATTLASVLVMDSATAADTLPVTNDEINIFFAPEIKKSFKNSVLSSVKQFSLKVETQTMLDFFQQAMSSMLSDTGKTVKAIDDFVIIKEQVSENKNEDLAMNSVQHNVPAWTMFGMFFIVISLAGGIIKERNDGSYLRILTMPGSYVTVMTGKIIAYLIICLMQCILMLMIGIYIMPLIGLPALAIGTSIPAMAVVAICSGLAATGYGILIGTIFNTQQQSSTFGAVSVVILAALGGIWVPIYVMPAAIRMLASFSPLYWGMSAFQDIFIHNAGIHSIIHNSFRLFLFFCLCITVSYFFNKARNR